MFNKKHGEGRKEDVLERKDDIQGTKGRRRKTMGWKET
jgi:hypothetical protein